VAPVKNLKSAAANQRPTVSILQTFSTGSPLQMHSLQRKVLRTICPDQKGLIARITNICYKHELNIVQNNEFVDHRTGRFFMRTELEGIFNDVTLLADLDSALPEGSIRELTPAGRRRIVILVTKEAHCLGDLLMKANYGGLDVEIAAVIGNHETLRPLVERFDIPFELVSHEGLTRDEHDQKMADAIDAHQPDYVVLAKYMRVLTPTFVSRFPNKIINIHHSFLPAFIGARPYHQAYERGVKIIGATAHYVNDNLDEGPIIMQDVIHVDHTYTAEDMMRAGRDVEKNVLSRALYQVLAQRVFVYGNRTIIL
jgi:formyltetrahydrofolate deformylase